MAAQRDSNGRFVKGNTAARGNRGGRLPRTDEEQYFDVFKEAVTLDKWRKATEAVLKKAMKGDVHAWKTLAQYGMRLPAQRIELDGNMRAVGMTLDEWKEQAHARIDEVENDPNMLGIGEGE